MKTKRTSDRRRKSEKGGGKGRGQGKKSPKDHTKKILLKNSKRLKLLRGWKSKEGMFAGGDVKKKGIDAARKTPLFLGPSLANMADKKGGNQQNQAKRLPSNLSGVLLQQQGGQSLQS